ncbi:hypothetical protein ACOSQ2_010641 [Xanthoceras sorbifolium]|uniref:Uncharacterized protein n=1 Tax=Xanthoceras sorbifolium TaxID=99658 RepID=A0ABQ8HTH7_9ROSI|nr:hypothetical protein JRO89_XS07G0114200 [Xanthoceras sorbifolium]
MSEAEEGFSGMDSMFSGFVLDPAKCSRLSLIEKRELVHEIAQQSKNAPEILSSFSRRELLEIICAEMGKQRKYSGYTKFRMIEHLLKLVSQNSKRSNPDKSFAFSSAKTQSGLKRKRQEEPLPQLLSDLNQVSPENKEKQVKIQVCQNVACKAALSLNDAFCKRCSCCICHQYDDNKDPSLWLTCGSDSSNENDKCGMSCHLECALKDEKAGITKIDCSTKLDGSFYCVFCGKINGLMRTWKKQLLVAKETRRVDVLCLRISLAHKILLRTEQYKEVQKKVETALCILTSEVGPLNLLCTKMARGIVNRLSCGAEVQKLCASAVEAFDSMFVADHVKKKEPASCQIRFEESSPTSVTIVLEYDDTILKDVSGCRLWHCKSGVNDYPDKPTYIVLRPQKRFLITDLDPSTEYFCKVSLFKSTGVVGVWEAKWITSASSGSFVTAFNIDRKKENTSAAQIHSKVESTNSSNIKSTFSEHPPKLPLSLALADINKSKDKDLSPKSISPSTPGKSDGMCEGPGLGCEKRREESNYEYSVRVVKWLEREGHIDEYFRVKFLTWFSLKATMHERRVVRVFVDAFINDPPSLAGQLTHTFMDEICCEQKQAHGNGLCTRWWH